MEEMNRRELITAAATACACLLCSDLTGLAAQPATRPVLAPLVPVEIGALKDFATEKVYDTWVSKGFVLIRQKDRLVAQSSICTHNNSARLGMKGELLVCPRHGGQFKPTGEVVKAPPKKPLPRCAISLNADGKIVVDPNKKFAQEQWDDKAAFLKPE